MNAGHHATWQKLSIAGLVTGDAPAAPPPESPWYVRGLLGAAGWLAAFFMLGFIGLVIAAVIENAAFSFMTGAVLVAAAGYVFARTPGNDFMGQFALAISFCGQALMGFGIWQGLGHEQERLTWTVMAVIQGVLAWWMPNTLHRTWSAFAAVTCCFLAANDQAGEFLVAPLALAGVAALWLNEFRWPNVAMRLRPIGYGAVAGLLVMDLATGAWQVALGFRPDATTEAINLAWLGQSLTGAVLLATVFLLLKGLRPAPSGAQRTGVLLATLALAAVSLEAPGIATGLTLLLLGRAHGIRGLMGLGTLALLAYIGTYYYRMDTTLLAKAQVLATTGVLALALRWWLLRAWPPARSAAEVTS